MIIIGYSASNIDIMLKYANYVQMNTKVGTLYWHFVAEKEDRVEEILKKQAVYLDEKYLNERPDKQNFQFLNNTKYYEKAKETTKKYEKEIKAYYAKLKLLGMDFYDIVDYEDKLLNINNILNTSLECCIKPNQNLKEGKFFKINKTELIYVKQKTIVFIAKIKGKNELEILKDIYLFKQGTIKGVEDDLHNYMNYVYRDMYLYE